MVDGGVLEDIRIHDIDLFHCGGPIFIRLGNRGRSYDESISQVYSEDAQPEGKPVGTLKDITIQNIKGTLYGRNSAVEGIMITGIPDHRIENLVLENIDLSFSGHGYIVERAVPEDEAQYPEQSFLACFLHMAFF